MILHLSSRIKVIRYFENVEFNKLFPTEGKFLETHDKIISLTDKELNELCAVVAKYGDKKEFDSLLNSLSDEVIKLNIAHENLVQTEIVLTKVKILNTAIKQLHRLLSSVSIENYIFPDMSQTVSTVYNIFKFFEKPMKTFFEKSQTDSESMYISPENKSQNNLLCELSSEFESIRNNIKRLVIDFLETRFKNNHLFEETEYIQSIFRTILALKLEDELIGKICVLFSKRITLSNDFSLNLNELRSFFVRERSNIVFLSTVLFRDVKESLITFLFETYKKELFEIRGNNIISTIRNYRLLLSFETEFNRSGLFSKKLKPILYEYIEYVRDNLEQIINGDDPKSRSDTSEKTRVNSESRSNSPEKLLLYIKKSRDFVVLFDTEELFCLVCVEYKHSLFQYLNKLRSEYFKSTRASELPNEFKSRTQDLSDDCGTVIEVLSSLESSLKSINKNSIGFSDLVEEYNSFLNLILTANGDRIANSFINELKQFIFVEKEGKKIRKTGKEILKELTLNEIDKLYSILLTSLSKEAHADSKSQSDFSKIIRKFESHSVFVNNYIIEKIVILFIELVKTVRTIHKQIQVFQLVTQSVKEILLMFESTYNVSERHRTVCKQFAMIELYIKLLHLEKSLLPIVYREMFGNTSDETLKMLLSWGYE